MSAELQQQVHAVAVLMADMSTLELTARDRALWAAYNRAHLEHSIAKGEGADEARLAALSKAITAANEAWLVVRRVVKARIREALIINLGFGKAELDDYT